MPEPCQYVAQSQCQSSRPVLLPSRRVHEKQFDQWFKSSLANGQAAVHIGFAKFKIQLDDETNQCSPVMYLYLGNRPVASAGETFMPSRRRCHVQVASDDVSSQQCQGEPFEHGVTASAYLQAKSDRTLIYNP